MVCVCQPLTAWNEGSRYRLMSIPTLVYALARIPGNMVIEKRAKIYLYKEGVNL